MLKSSGGETEFRKFLDHPSLVANNPLFSLAHVGLAHPYPLQGEVSKRAAYQDFLTLWRDADRDIPILKEAQAEFAKRQWAHRGDADSALGLSPPLPQNQRLYSLP